MKRRTFLANSAILMASAPLGALNPGKLFGPTASPYVFPGADDTTPSRSRYESWINNTNEGPTEFQTLINFDFFKWLHDEFGMQLDIYCVSAGTIDKRMWYGSMDSPEFKAQFPNGLRPVYEKAREIGTRLGTWGGPDGYGNTQEEEDARIEMMVSLCRDYDFILFKLDAVVGQLRDDKQDAFIRMMTESRKYSPDLILLNHRLNLSEEARKHVTTSLWEGAETYVDVHMANTITAPHHRQGNISRNVVPDLMRLTEDHGVCISSCLDYWEDDLVLHAFNRNLILAPQIYGNPWLLRDNEYARLARIYNIARKYREIMTQGLFLPEETYGEKAISRGNSNTRLLSLRNISWERTTITGTLSEEIGVSENTRFEVRLLHPVERVLGRYRKGDSFTVEVEPFRAALVLVCPNGDAGVGVEGCDFEVIQDVPDKPLKIALKGMPGSNQRIALKSANREYVRAEIDGSPVNALVRNSRTTVSFPGEPLKEHWHRKLENLVPVVLPTDAESLYEATVFSADNNALEVRSLKRSGESSIPQVKAARDAFFEQKLFVERGVWDRYMFDGDPETSFYISRRRANNSEVINGGALRIDFGRSVRMDELIVHVGSEFSLQPWKSEEAVRLQVSDDLKNWDQVIALAREVIRIKIDPEKPIRYVRFDGTPDRVVDISGYLNGEALDRSNWRGSMLFSPYRRLQPDKAWSASTVLHEIPKGSYLAIAINGEHGIEGAYAAIRVDGVPVGAPDRSPSYICSPWEYNVRKTPRNYTYYVPLDASMKGKQIDVVVLGMRECNPDIKPEVWLTTYPVPYEEKELVLYRD